jgi:multidrug resistance efflux pump
MAPTGSKVQEGDVVVRFDPSRTKQQPAEKLAVLKQAQAALDQPEAEARITAEQDRRTLSEAGFQVARVKLDISPAEIVSALKAEESKIELKLSEERLAPQPANAELNAASSRNEWSHGLGGPADTGCDQHPGQGAVHQGSA